VTDEEALRFSGETMTALAFVEANDGDRLTDDDKATVVQHMTIWLKLDRLEQLLGKSR
jgi:hypothetical protein